MHILSDELAREVKANLAAFDPTIQKLSKKCDADIIISEMDKAGTDKALVFSGAYLWSTILPAKAIPMIAEPLQYEKVKQENNWTAAQAAKYADRLVPVFSINPLADYAIEEMDRCIEEQGVKAMKLHLGSSSVNINDYNQLRKLNDVLSHAEKRGIPVIIHIWTKFSQPKDSQIIIDKILAKHPDLRVCIAHLGYVGEPEMKVMEAIVTAYNKNEKLNKANLFFDMSAVIWTKDTVSILPETSQESLDKMAKLIKAWGPERILWGSDYFAREPKEFLDATINHLNLEAKDMKKLLYKKPEDFLQ